MTIQVSPGSSAWLPLLIVLAAATTLPGCERVSAQPAGAPVGVVPAAADEEGVAKLSVSTVCAQCHSASPDARALRDAAGGSIAPYDLWSGTMMANAARDPLWRAVVSAELAATPARAADIERACLTCHAPMAARVGLEAAPDGSFMDVLERDDALGVLARDGVSCTICHGMSAEGLGTEESFSAGFLLDGQARLFGPHEQPFTMPMRHHTGFTPTYGQHVLDSALCGSCHTLITDTYAPDGSHDGGRFLEQAPYLEWRNSSYVDEAGVRGSRATSCQGCHVPTVDSAGAPVRTRIARNPMGRDFPGIQERSPFGRHTFVGGNTLVPALLRDHGDELATRASRAAFDGVIAATREQLGSRAARVALQAPQRDGDRLVFDVQIENLTGHKLPTAHPTRRAWLRVIVRDAAGGLVFASGRTDGSGRIVGAAGVPLPSERRGGPIDGHLDVVRSGDEVVRYEAVMADSDGAATFTLMRGASWLLDTRLLPHGWEPEHAEADRTAAVGVAGDVSFRAGGDTVRYELTVPRDAALTVEVDLLYQPLGARWLDELARWDTPEITALQRMLDTADRMPEVLGSDRLEL